MNDAKKTGNITALQSAQKSICRKFRVVVRQLVTLSGDLPHPVLPKLDVRPVLVIAYKIEPVRRHAVLNIVYGASQMTFEEGDHSTGLPLPLRCPSLRSASLRIAFSLSVSLNEQHGGRCEWLEALEYRDG